MMCVPWGLDFCHQLVVFVLDKIVANYSFNFLVLTSQLNLDRVVGVTKACVAGMRNRSVGSHSMNEHSSRSHTILTVNITSEQQVQTYQTPPVLHFNLLYH